MATAGHDRHAGGRPPTIKKLTPFGSVLNPVLVERGWNVNILGEETGLHPHTIWWWMKKAKKWPPADAVALISAALGVRIEPPSPSESR